VHGRESYIIVSTNSKCGKGFGLLGGGGEGAIMEAVVLLCVAAFILYKSVPPEVKLRLEYELYKRGFIKYK
jgi:hypothetical protein